jgi:hypothetical protein
MAALHGSFCDLKIIASRERERERERETIESDPCSPTLIQDFP